MLALLLVVLGAVATAVVALRSDDDRLTQVLSCTALGCRAAVAVARSRGRSRARR